METWIVLGSAVVRRAGIIDQFSTDEGTVVLVDLGSGHHLVRLSPLGAAILDSVGDGLDVTALADALTKKFGAPDGQTVEEALATHLRELAEHGVIVVAES